MGRKLDWLGGKLGATDNPLGSLLGWGVATAAPWAGGKAGSLLRGAGRGMGAFRDRMSRQGSGVDSWGEDDSFSPRKIPSGDDGLGNTGEVLIRLTSIENILRGMSELATESGQRDATSVETDRQAQEELHRLAEQEPDGPDISLSPTRVEEEKKSGGLFSSLFGGLGKLLTFLGPTGSIIVGLGLLAGAFALFNKFFGGGEGEGGEGGGGRDRLDPTTRQLVRMGVGVPGLTSAVGRGGGRAAAYGMERTATSMEARSATTPRRLSRAADVAQSNLDEAVDARRGLRRRPAAPRADIIERRILPSVQADYDVRQADWIRDKNKLDNAITTAQAKKDDVAKAVARRSGRLTTNASRLQRFAPALRVAGKGLAVAGPAMDAWQYKDMEEGWQKTMKAWAIGLGTVGAISTMTGYGAVVGLPAMGIATLLSLGADYGDRIPDLWDWGKEKSSGAVNFALGPPRDRPHQPFRAPQSKLGYIQSELELAGYSYDQAQAVMKNMDEESGFNENAEGDYQTIGRERRPTAFGIAQWRGGRAENMEAHVAGRGLSRFEGQVEFLIEELKEYGLSPQQMPDDFALASNAVLGDYLKPAQVHVDERTVDPGTPAPGRAPRTPSWTATHDFSGVGAGAYRTPPAPVAAIAGSRTAAAAVGPEEGESLTPMAVVAPQTTNNFFDNRITNIMRPPLDARNPSADLKALQDIQGTTHALA